MSHPQYPFTNVPLSGDLQQPTLPLYDAEESVLVLLHFYVERCIGLDRYTSSKRHTKNRLMGTENMHLIKLRILQTRMSACVWREMWSNPSAGTTFPCAWARDLEQCLLFLLPSQTINTSFFTILLCMLTGSVPMDTHVADAMLKMLNPQMFSTFLFPCSLLQ